MPSAPRPRPSTAAQTVSIVKMPFAFSGSFSPSFFAISALPPVPNMKPGQPRIIRTGMMKLTAAKGVLPAKFETKKPSTTP